MEAKDYRVTFPFKGQDGKYYGPNGIVGEFHLGDDRATPSNTIIKILGTLIGYSGNTGISSGPHTHAEKWKEGRHAGGVYVAKYNRTYWKPTNIFNAPGTVIYVGYLGAAGNTVRWKGDDGFTYGIFHLNRVSIKRGAKIMAVPKVKKVYMDRIVEHFLGRKPNSAEVKNWPNKVTYEWIVKEMMTRKDKVNNTLYKIRNFAKLEKSRNDAQKALGKVRTERDQLLEQRDDAIVAKQEAQNAMLESEGRVSELEADVDELTLALGSANTQVKELEAQLAAVSDDTKQLNALGSFLRWLIQRVGLGSNKE